MNLHTNDNHDSEVVWFFGPSAVGKETIINKLSSGDKTLAGELNLRGSAELYEQSLSKGRILNPRSIASRRKRGCSLLIKVQWEDIINGKNIPMDLKNLIPDSWHKVVLLYADKPIQDLHYKQRRRGDWNYTHPFIYEFIKHGDGGMYGAAENLKTQGFDALYVKVLQNEYELMSDQEVGDIVIKFQGGSN